MNCNSTIAERMDVLHRHQAADWRQDTDCDINLDEPKVMAEDLRTTAELIKVFPTEEVRDLADDLICASAAQMETVGKLIAFWTRYVQSRDGDAQITALKKRMAEQYPEGAPHKLLPKRTMAVMRLALETLRQEAACGCRTRSDSADFIASVMMWAATVMDWLVSWLVLLLRQVAATSKAENNRRCVCS